MSTPNINTGADEHLSRIEEAANRGLATNDLTELRESTTLIENNLAVIGNLERSQNLWISIDRNRINSVLSTINQLQGHHTLEAGSDKTTEDLIEEVRGRISGIQQGLLALNHTPNTSSANIEPDDFWDDNTTAPQGNPNTGGGGNTTAPQGNPNTGGGGNTTAPQGNPNGPQNGPNINNGPQLANTINTLNNIMGMRVMTRAEVINQIQTKNRTGWDASMRQWFADRSSEKNFAIQKEAKENNILILEDQPALLAFHDLLNSDPTIDLNNLQNFFHDPKNLTVPVSANIRTEIESRRNNPNGNQLNYEELQIQINTNIEDITNNIEDNTADIRKSYGLNQNDKDRLKNQNRNLRRQLSRERELLKATDTLKSLNKRQLTYTSPRQTLGMLGLYIERIHNDNPNINMQTISSDLQQRIDQHESRLSENVWDRFSVLKPTLAGTLRNIGEKDKKFKDLGENPADILGELAAPNSINYKSIEAWVENLPGKLEAHGNTTVPLLVAYLEMAVRDGATKKHLFKRGKTIELIQHLRAVQDKHIDQLVEKEFENRADVEEAEIMLRRLQLKNDADKIKNELNAAILKETTYKSTGIKLAALAGGGSAAALGLLSISPLITIPALAAAPIMIASKTKLFSEKNRPKMMKNGLRIAATATLATGAGMAGILSGGLLLPIAAAGACAPFIGRKSWEKRGQIAQVGKMTAKGVGKIGKHTIPPLVGGSAGLLKRSLNATGWGIKRTFLPWTFFTDPNGLKQAITNKKNNVPKP